MVGDRIIAWLCTPGATLIVLATALIAQLPHAADVFRLVVRSDGILAQMHSYSYAVALELAVLLFVVQRRNAESYVFAAVSVSVNLAYYALHGVELFSVAALPSWLISVALPAAIARYSHLIVDAAHPAHPAQVDAAQAQVQAQGQAQTSTDVLPAQEAQAAAPPAQSKRTQTHANARKRTQAQTPSAAHRRLRIAQSNLSDAKTVAAQFGISLRTAQADLAALRNGASHKEIEHE